MPWQRQQLCHASRNGMPGTVLSAAIQPRPASASSGYIHPHRETFGLRAVKGRPGASCSCRAYSVARYRHLSQWLLSGTMPPKGRERKVSNAAVRTWSWDGDMGDALGDVLRLIVRPYYAHAISLSTLRVDQGGVDIRGQASGKKTKACITRKKGKMR